MIFTIVLVDNNIIKMDACLNTNKQIFLEAVAFIKNAGVTVEDEKGLLNMLAKGDDIYQYIKEIEDHNNA